jgi:hypothetical protein
LGLSTRKIEPDRLGPDVVQLHRYLRMVRQIPRPLRQKDYAGILFVPVGRQALSCKEIFHNRFDLNDTKSFSEPKRSGLSRGII